MTDNEVIDLGVRYADGELSDEEFVRRVRATSRCEACAAEGMQSSAIACVLHSTLKVQELEANIAALKDTAGAGSRLHVAIADMFSAVPSLDGSEELASIRETQDRLERVRLAIEYALHLANWDDDEARKVEKELLAAWKRKP